jgi:hypothetical protein
MQLVGMFVSVGGELWKQLIRSAGKWVQMLLMDDALGLLEHPTGSPHICPYRRTPLYTERRNESIANIWFSR